ncbi:MAG TPA: site-specific tyrosine recombinase/integron integrase [Bacteroidia bacterium]|nr:site-specific tyrosine recombinase/integron integrase [Bacteroidia bacterium]
MLITNKESFINHLKFEKRLSPHTSLSYSNDLDQFFIYLKNVYQIHTINQINHSIIRSWVVSLMENKLTARSVNRKISTLKSFYKFLLREKTIETNPMNKIQTPKIPKRLPVFIEESKMNSLIEDVKFSSDFEGKRNLLIIELLYATGMRRAELINLKEGDINFNNHTIKVLGKRNKERLIPITNELGTLINEYISERKNINTNNDFLFITKSGKQIYASAVYRTVRDSLAKVTTASKKSPHILRHSFATHLLNNGANLNAIKELLGHANLAATQVYTHNTIEKLKSVYSKAHPKA